MLKRVLDRKMKQQNFLNSKRRQWLHLFHEQDWIYKLCYLSDIFERLKTLNLSLQGKESNIMDFVNKLSAFQKVLDLWENKIKAGDWQCFSPCSYIEDCESVSESLKNDIESHLQSLRDEFKDNLLK